MNLLELYFIKAVKRLIGKNKSTRARRILEELNNPKKLVTANRKEHLVKPGILNVPIELYNEAEKDCEIHLGDYDQDGFLLPAVDGMHGIPIIDGDAFLKRSRFDVSLIIKNGYLCIKKYYNGNVHAFSREILALALANKAGCNVPSLLDIDSDNLAITISYIHGEVLREKLAKRGARIRDSQVGRNFEYAYFERRRVIKRRRLEGKNFLHDVVNTNFIDQLEQEYKKLFGCGIVNNDIKYGNVIIEKYTQKPFLIDFETSWIFKNPDSYLCRLIARHDGYVFDQHFR